jgi:hypothetical protein
MPDEFGKFIETAQGTGDRSESRFSPMPFEREAAGGKKRPKYNYQCRIFTIFRPWQECRRCSHQLRSRKDEDGTIVDPLDALPDGADYVCPHNENRDYTILVNRCASNEVALIRRTLETLKTGVVQALVEWGEPLGGRQKEEDPGFPTL